ncbi:VOC family protein [Actinocorallia populi]|uniref:VOC family protein n=1 Tax=Actinocorallia populi TaxID=2079200 RepID=UPI000D090F8F|nr:VOC family protein [Actinocorallia populi]
MTASDITGLHHVGLVVHDMSAAIVTFRRLGFHIGPPAYPALPPSPGTAPEPIGAGNTHADFPLGFIELLAFAPSNREDLPAEAKLIPLHIPDDRLDATRQAIRGTVAGLADRLDRSEGAHILVFATADAEKTAARLAAAGIGSSGALAAQRPITTGEGTRLEAIKYLEINGHQETGGGMPPEGRVGAAENPPPAVLDAQIGLDHPNGAVALAECLLCVADGELDRTAERYERHLGVTARRDGSSRHFDLGPDRLTITTPAGLSARLPGERARDLPALSAYTVEVADLTAAERLLESQGAHPRYTATGEVFVPAAEAHGAAIIFRQAATIA